MGRNRPVFRFGFNRSRTGEALFSQLLPMDKSLPAILFVVGFLAAFSIPFFTMAARPFGNTDDLFDFVFNFMFLFGALVWGAVVLVRFVLLLALCFACERIMVDRKGIELRIELFGLGFSSFYTARGLSRLRSGKDSKTTEQEPGEQLSFDYYGVPVSVGSVMPPDQARRLAAGIEQALDFTIPQALSASVEIHKEKEEQLELQRTAAAEEKLNCEKAWARAQQEQMQMTLSWHSPSAILLVLANLLPLAGVLWYGWDIGDLFLLFWIESAIIGIFNILKMIVVGKFAALFMGIFFIAHFGGFMFGHLLFIFGFFVEGANDTSFSLEQVRSILLSLWPGIVALSISHGFSFFDNFIGKKEYLLRTLNQQMGEPYKRIIIMHFTIIPGGFLVMALNAPVLALLLLILLKSMVDFGAHIREHSGTGQKSGKGA